MLKPIRPVLTGLVCVLAGISAACTNSASDRTGPAGSQPQEVPIAAATALPDNRPVAAAPSAPPEEDAYNLAIERASSAYRLSQSAQSRDDWRLVARRWQQAVELLNGVPATHPQRNQVLQKRGEYRRNLNFAQQQANRQTAPANANGVIVLPSQTAARPQTRAATPPPVVTPAASPVAATSAPNTDRVFYAPIIRREGNTPVISVLFNNNQRFDMIVDTGASGTLITRQMSAALDVVPVAQTSVDTASERGVSFPLGYVRQMEVGGAVATNVLVAVAGPELDIGLLGHDFFGHYDVTIRASEVEFRERSKLE